MPSLAAISLDGAKGVGKTLTAGRRARTTYQLDDPGMLEIVEADPERLTHGSPPILIDEWQRYPHSWDVVRRAVDDHRRPGRFLLTGSASPLTPSAHSGAGRIVVVRMRPLSLAEREIELPTVSLARLLEGGREPLDGSTSMGLDEYAHEICASGFPGLRTLRGRALRAALDGYIDRIVDRDFGEMGRPVRRPWALRRWLAAYAAATSTAASYETVRDAATPGQAEKPAKTTTTAYRDVLERLWVLDPVPAWLPTRSHIQRLGAAPKHHLADPALAARILNADPAALLEARPLGPSIARDGTLLGHLFESLVALSVRVYAQAAEATVRHLRTRGGGHEVDLIVERPDHRVVAIEVKLAQTPDADDLRHLHWLRERIGEELLDAVVITTGREAYRRRDGIAVVPAALLGP